MAYCLFMFNHAWPLMIQVTDHWCIYTSLADCNESNQAVFLSHASLHSAWLWLLRQILIIFPTTHEQYISAPTCYIGIYAIRKYGKYAYIAGRYWYCFSKHINIIVQNCDISNAFAMEIPQSSTELLIWYLHLFIFVTKNSITKGAKLPCFNQHVFFTIALDWGGQRV